MSTIAPTPNPIDAFAALPSNDLESQTVLSNPFEGEMTVADDDEIEMAVAQRNIDLLRAKAEAACLMPAVVNQLAHMMEMDIAMSELHGGRVDDDSYCSNRKG